MFELRGADVAQLVERWFCKPNVAGSFPATGLLLPDSLTGKAVDFGSTESRFES